MNSPAADIDITIKLSHWISYIAKGGSVDIRLDWMFVTICKDITSIKHSLQINIFLLYDFSLAKN